MAISVNHKKTRFLPQRAGESSRTISRQWRDLSRVFSKPVKSRDLIFFTSQLALMLEIGTSLSQALKALAAQISHGTLAEVITAMRQDVEGGRQLSEAMKRHPSVFDQVFVSMVKAGESGSFLKRILDRLAEMQEKRQVILSQVRSSLTYPVILCILGVLVVAFILVGVLPKFTAFFSGKEHILPLSTRALIYLSGSLRQYWWAYLFFSSALALSAKLVIKRDRGQAFLDRFCVSAPLLARLSNKVYTCQLLRTLGALMESQVPLLEALAVTRGTIKNRYFQHFIDEIADHVQEGGRFAQPFSTYPYVAPSVKQMVATGEEAGELPRVMLRLAEYYDTEVERDFKTLASMVEPLALLVFGGVVGLIVSSVILPLFKIAQALH